MICKWERLAYNLSERILCTLDRRLLISKKLDTSVVWYEHWHIVVKIGAVCNASFFNTRGEKLSRPADLFGLRFFSSLCTQFSVIFMFKIVHRFRTCYIILEIIFLLWWFCLKRLSTIGYWVCLLYLLALDVKLHLILEVVFYSHLPFCVL